MSALWWRDSNIYKCRRYRIQDIFNPPSVGEKILQLIKRISQSALSSPRCLFFVFFSVFILELLAWAQTVHSTCIQLVATCLKHSVIVKQILCNTLLGASGRKVCVLELFRLFVQPNVGRATRDVHSTSETLAGDH
jgi:hypothetical protein